MTAVRHQGPPTIHRLHRETEKRNSFFCTMVSSWTFAEVLPATMKECARWTVWSDKDGEKLGKKKQLSQS